MAFILPLEVEKYTCSHFTLAERTHKGSLFVKVTEEVHNRKANSVSLPGIDPMFTPLKQPSFLMVFSVFLSCIEKSFLSPLFNTIHIHCLLKINKLKLQFDHLMLYVG